MTILLLPVVREIKAHVAKSQCHRTGQCADSGDVFLPRSQIAGVVLQQEKRQFRDKHQGIRRQYDEKQPAWKMLPERLHCPGKVQ